MNSRGIRRTSVLCVPFLRSKSCRQINYCLWNLKCATGQNRGLRIENRRSLWLIKILRYFMREEAKVEQIVTVPGPESIKDENGNVIQLEIKQLHNDTIAKINEMYESKTPLKDKKVISLFRMAMLYIRSRETETRQPATSW